MLLLYTTDYQSCVYTTQHENLNQNRMEFLVCVEMHEAAENINLNFDIYSTLVKHIPLS